MAIMVSVQQIKEVLKNIDPVEVIIPLIEEGFVAYSQGRVVVPPVGEMIFEDPPGDAHIKYGYIKGDDYYVVKIASGFYEKTRMGRATGHGLMLLFSQKNGELVCVLHDEAYLTNIRTAAAGAIAAKYLAPQKVRRVGIIGAGIQGRMQLGYLRFVREFKDVIVWGINNQELDAYKRDLAPLGFNIHTTLYREEVASNCSVIVTCTPSKRPLLQADQIQKGTHITAVGADTPEKQELDSAILKKADRVVVDSLSQCLLRGEAFHALQQGLVKKENLVELGMVIANKNFQRASEAEITVADLTGVAVQDIQISKAVWKALKEKA
jgi:ornithine cyclodeaminase